jgi:glycosyltransferase involved in cell wall biosynthesis
VKPRVLLMSQEVHPIPPVKGAAVEQWIAAVAARMTRYEPHVVSVPHPTRPDQEVEAGVHYRRIRIGRAYNRVFRKITRLDPYSYADRVLNYARAIRPAVVHIHNAPQLTDPLIRGLAATKGARPSIILHMHNEKQDRLQSALDALVGCSTYICQWYRARQLRADRFAVIGNGVDLARYSASRPEAALRELRARHGVPADRFIVLYAGRISPEKGPDLLAAAMRHVDPARFHLLLVGEWPQGDANKSERVRFANELQRDLQAVPHTVIDTVAPEDMPAMYGLGDLLVIPSRFEEPFSMVAIEAMAAGLPIVALKRGGMAEYMIDGENARVLSAASTSEQLGKAIEVAAGAKDDLARLARNARAMVEARFDWAKITSDTERLYDDLVQGAEANRQAGVCA